MDTKKKLACALIECMDAKPLDRISVAEISAKAEVSKQTFYRYFDDKYDLMDFCFQHIFETPLGMIAQGDDYAQAMRTFFVLCRREERFMRSAFKSEDINSMYAALFKALRRAYGARVTGQGGSDEGDTWFVLECYAKNITGMTRHWMGEGVFMPEDPRSIDELVSLCAKCLPTLIAPYFL